MVNINLIPWREQQALYERRTLLQLLIGSILGALLILVVADRYLAHQQDTQAQHLEHFKKELIWREGLVNRTQVTNAFTSYDKLDDFFQRLNEVDTQQVCFQQIKKTKLGIEMMGIATSPELLTVFLQTSTMSSYFSELKINQLRQGSGELQFNLLGKLNAI